MHGHDLYDKGVGFAGFVDADSGKGIRAEGRHQAGFPEYLPDQVAPVRAAFPWRSGFAQRFCIFLKICKFAAGKVPVPAYLRTGGAGAFPRGKRRDGASGSGGVCRDREQE